MRNEDGVMRGTEPEGWKRYLDRGGYWVREKPGARKAPGNQEWLQLRLLEIVERAPELAFPC